MKGGRLAVLTAVGSLTGALALGSSSLPAVAGPGTANPSVRTTGPAKTANLAHPPSAGPHRGGALPFLPRDRAAYARAKVTANSRQVGGRQGPAVHAISGGQASTPATPGSSIGVVNNFRGGDLATQLAAYGNDNKVTPPDTTLAMGNGFVVEPLNDTVSVYTSSGQLQENPDLYAFFAPVLPTNHHLSDPQAVFDSVTPDHRFYMTIMGFDPTTNDSEVLLAASLTSDPTGSWKLYSLGTTPGVLQDQPFLGISDDKLTISVDDFNGSNTFIGSATTVLNKADADAGATIHNQSFGTDPFFRPSPARSTSAITTQYVVSNDSPSLDVMEITGLPSATTVASRTVTTLSTASMATPPDATQPGLGPSISTNDTGALESVWQGNVLWVGANDGCTPSGDSSERSCLRLFELAAPVSGPPSVMQDFDVGTAGIDLYYPGVALDKNNNLYVSCSFSDFSTAYPSAQVLAFAGGNPDASAVTTLHSGSVYHGIDLASPSWRWGDYSGAAIDPTNPSDVWVATEFGGGDTVLGTGTNWATQLSQVTIAPSVLPRSYHPLTPARITDTRSASGEPNAGNTLTPGGTLDVRVAGAGGLPITGATAAVLNVTATNPTQSSFVTVWPTGATRPTASNLNFRPGQTVPNLVEVGLGTNGAVSIFNLAGSVDIVVDVEGYVGPSASAGTGLYNSLTPARITDTRPGSGFPNAGNTLGPGATLTVQVTGAGGVPPTSGVAAAVLNVTATNPTKQSFLTMWPTGAAQPLASNLNFGPGQTVPNRVMVPVGAGGKVSVFNPTGFVDVVVDVGGYFTDPSNVTGAQFTPTTPTRITDTRPGSGFPNAGKTLGPGGILDVQVSGVDGVPPTGVAAAVLNVTVTDSTQPSFLTVWPTGVTQPIASDLNWVSGQTVPNLVVVKLGPTGAVSVFNATGQVDVVVDVSGWYS